MRVQHDAVHLETIGTVEENAFSIKATGKAFRMLIDGLYSNKIGSIAREVPTNAYDSHIMAGINVPFYIHCPNVQRPEFFVRDYGIGMDHDTVMHLYSTLFESNKDETDDLVGAFGLGSKSPFAYADQFSVSCYDGAIVRHYTAAIGVGGQPKIMLMGTEPNVEPRGVRVTIGVEAKDFDKFSDEVRKVAMGFDPPFETNIDLGIKRGELVYEGEAGDWKCYTGSSLPATWNVRQGCVIYPLADQGGLTLPYDSGRKWLIEAPIGTIAVTGSREAVQYKDTVVAYLKQRIEGVIKEVEARVWEKVKDITYVVDFFNTYAKLRPNFLSASVVHPASGLSSTTLRLENMASLYTAVYDASRERWGYQIDRTINLQDKAGLTCFNLRDVTPLLDPSRDDAPAQDYSKSEGKRISRMLRAYCEQSKLDKGVFLIGVDFDKPFLDAVLPKAKITEVSYDELRMATPRRPLAPAVPLQPAIRGLALAIKAGDQSPVTEIDADVMGAAWIDSDTYRRRPEDIFNLAKKFNLTKLYIASPTAEKVIAGAAVPALKDAIDAVLVKDHGITLIDYHLIHGSLTTYDDSWSFARKVMNSDPALYDKITRIKSPVATFYKSVRAIAVSTFPKLEDRDRATIRSLFSPLNIYKAPQGSSVVKTFEEAHKAVEKCSYHPIDGLMSKFSNAKSKAQIAACVEALIAVLRILPLSMKFESK